MGMVTSEGVARVLRREARVGGVRGGEKRGVGRRRRGEWGVGGERQGCVGSSESLEERKKDLEEGLEGTGEGGEDGPEFKGKVDVPATLSVGSGKGGGENVPRPAPLDHVENP